MELNRRQFIQTMIAAGATAMVRGRHVHAAQGLTTLGELSTDEKLDWFQRKLGPQGSLWPKLRQGDFTDEELKNIITALADVAEVLNNTDKTKLRGRLLALRERIDKEQFSHLYTIAIAARGKKDEDGSERLVDIGNAEIIEFNGRPYLRTAEHVIDCLRNLNSILCDNMFFTPPPLKPGDPTPDECVALLENVPLGKGMNPPTKKLPTDFDQKSIGGQLNLLQGYKEDGGIVKFAGVVLPCPPLMLNRLSNFLEFSKGTTELQKFISAQMGQGGIILLPKFFSQTFQNDAKGIRAAGRSGTPRRVLSPKHNEFIPAAGLIQVIAHLEIMGFSIGVVDSASHLFRAVEALDRRASSPDVAKRPHELVCVPDASRPETWELADGIYLRSVPSGT